jgi:hypothetical protein
MFVCLSEFAHTERYCTVIILIDAGRGVDNHNPPPVSPSVMSYIWQSQALFFCPVLLCPSGIYRYRMYACTGPHLETQVKPRSTAQASTALCEMRIEARVAQVCPRSHNSPRHGSRGPRDSSPNRVRPRPVLRDIASTWSATCSIAGEALRAHPQSAVLCGAVLYAIDPNAGDLELEMEWAM